MTNANTEATIPATGEDSLESLALAYSRATEKVRAQMTDGLAARAMAALDAGNMEEANHWAQLRRDVVTASQGVEADYAMAQRVASFRMVLADLEANLSDRARDLVDTGTVGASDHLVARLNGVNVTRTAVSDDGANRAGSDEPKGSVKEALIGFLATQAVGSWATIAAAGKWITAHGAEYGYTPNYVISGGAILARNHGNDTSTKWRLDNNIEFAKVPGMGTHGPAPVWCVRRTA